MADISIPADLALIILSGLAAGELYAAYLKPRQHKYNPHWTWAVVVIGTVLTWLIFVALAARGYTSWSSVGWFVVVFLATGFGILRWQIPQTLSHLREQRARRPYGRTEVARRGRDHHSAP